MKRINATWTALALCALCTACGGKNSEQQNGDSTQVSRKADDTYAEPETKRTFTAKLNGQTFDIAIVRSADKSLPVVTDDMGKRYYDYRVEVTIASNGKLFYTHSYTKEDFADHLSADEKKAMVLLGMAYDSVTSDNDHICLGAQVGQIGLEEGPAFRITIPINGSAPTIERDNRQDTSGNDGLGGEDIGD